MPTHSPHTPLSRRSALLGACSAAAALAMAPVAGAAAPAISASPSANAALSDAALAGKLQVGDLVFIRVSARPFREVAAATDSWTNHVGVVSELADGSDNSDNTDKAGGPMIAESTFPFSHTTTWSRFAARSEGGRVAVLRLKDGLTEEQQTRLRAAVAARQGIFYDTGFDLHSRRQFCSRYVREVLQQAAGIEVGETETFATLLARRPDTRLGFWKVWYFGRIPWQRVTVTPASLLNSPVLRVVYDGTATQATKAP